MTKIKVIPCVRVLDGFPGRPAVKKLPLQYRRCGSDPWVRRPLGGGQGNLLKYSCLDNSMDKRSLAGYSPQGHKEWGMTEATEHTVFKGAK